MEQVSEENNKRVPKFVKISQVKLVSTPTDKKPNATRHGISIFSPTKSHQHSIFSNGVEIKYRECLKNHFARSGGHVVDGCGEFMHGGDIGTDEFLICDACDCHRNFHRKEVVPLPPRPPLSNPSNNACTKSRMVSFGGEASESSGEEHVVFIGGEGTNKRFRTKFSKEQKDEMNKMAGKLGWKIQKQDEEEMERVCGEIGVSREVFRVWMNNCKQAVKRRRCV